VTASKKIKLTLPSSGEKEQQKSPSRRKNKQTAGPACYTYKKQQGPQIIKTAREI
jgi:hypothetical protein